MKHQVQHLSDRQEFFTKALLGLVEATAFKTGTEYIQSMVKYFVDHTQVHRAFIARRVSFENDELETLAFWDAHGFTKNFHYDMSGTPCREVYCQKKVIILNKELQQSLPGSDKNMESYLGIPLFDSDRRVFGHFAILHDAPFKDPATIRNLAYLFGSRVATELLRQQAHQELELKNKELSLTLKQLQDIQKQVIHQEKMASLGNLTAGIAHEIKNPLNFVNNFSKISRELLDELNEDLLIKRKEPGSEDIQELFNDLNLNLELIDKHGKRADDIVHRMLNHSRGQDNDPVMADINKLLDESYNLAYHSLRARDSHFNCDIQWNLDDGLPQILVFPLSLDRAFRSILENSFTALKMKSPFSDPKIIISSTETQSKLVISIQDNGVGIPADILGNIFDPFFTTKPSDSSIGLGLSISYDIICSEHNGDIKADSREGEYTRITIELKK